MHEFLTLHRADLIARCRAKAALRPSPYASEEEFGFGVPTFIDELIKTLLVEQGADPMLSRRVSGVDGAASAQISEMGESAARHGGHLMHRGYTVEQVVHDYGDLCQAITDLAVELGEDIKVDEFRTLNRCLDNAIAGAVTEFNYQRDFLVADRQADALNARLGVFAHELRNLLHTAALALSALKTGSVGVTGATGAVLERSLVGLRVLVDRSLAEVRVAAGVPVQTMMFSLFDFVAELKVSASLEADLRGGVLFVAPVDPKLALDGDRDLLLAAVGNLLQNAFKFTHPGTIVTLSAYAAADRILIDVEDHCGGLPVGDVDRLFQPFTQAGEDRSGLGLGLSIARASVEAVGGRLSVRDLPGRGCVFTIDLPRRRVGDAPGASNAQAPEILAAEPDQA
jgi:signal transduction histidine kinase